MAPFPAAVLSLLTLLTAHLSGLAAAEPPPVVLVHGLGGFGPNEGLFLSYWPLKSEYSNAGLRVLESAVGPVSSDWDRACELYAQLKGVQTDYGVAHSARYGHHRFGRDYTGRGLYPEWNSSFPINLVGHSMGGTTARLLEILLQEGDARERIAGGDLSPLFQGNKTDLITSLTAYATPHDGTVLVDALGSGFVGFLQTFILAFAVLVGDTFIDEIYDFQLEHWDLQRQSGEGLVSYMARIFQSPVFSPSNEDISVFDLSPEGAKALQQRGAQAYPNTHYLSYATEYTNTNFLDCAFLSSDCSQIAKPLMWLPLQVTAIPIGSRRQSPQGFRANDGLVSLESGKCPTLAYNTTSTSSCPRYEGNWFPGTWLWETVELDHQEILGFSLRGQPARSTFREHAQRLLGIQN